MGTILFPKGLIKKTEWDFPGDPVDRNLAANACNVDLISVPGRFHMPWGN